MSRDFATKMAAEREREAALTAALEALGYVLKPHSGPDGCWLDVQSKDGGSSQRFDCTEEVERFIADEQAKTRATSGSAARTGLLHGNPKLNDRVHYTSYGSPGGEYPRTCRAATVTEVFPGSPESVSLFVTNPTGTFFDQAVDYDPGVYNGGERTAVPGESLPLIGCADLEFTGGTWHWAAGA